MTREEALMVHRAIDGSLDPEDFPLLEELLERDGEALDLYCADARIRGRLEWHFSTLGSPYAAAKQKAELIEHSRFLQHRRIVKSSLAIAALLLLCVGLTFFLIRSSNRPTLSVRFGDDVEYGILRNGGSQGEATEDTVLREGDLLKITKGAVELTFPKGVRSIVQAPAELSLTGENRIRMERGIAYFEITDPRAKGFAVSLQGSEVTDLGTRFGIKAMAGESAEIHVFQGHVQAVRTGGVKGRTILGAGQAVREDDGSPNGYASIIGRADRFPRTLSGKPGQTHLSFDERSADGGLLATGIDFQGKVEIISRNGGKPEIIPGKVGKAMRFDGSGSYLRVTGWKGIEGNSPRTTAFWARFPEIHPQPEHRGMSLITWGYPDNTRNRLWEVNLNSGDQGSPGVVRVTLGSAHFSLGSRYLYDGEWHHIVTVYDPDPQGGMHLKTYIDGDPDGMSDQFIGKVNTGFADSFQIGKNLDPLQIKNFALAGDLDEIRIFDRALSPGEINSIRHEPISR